MYKSFEGFKQFSIYEGVDQTIPPEIQTRINTGKKLIGNISQNYIDISKNYIDISNNIDTYNIITSKLRSSNDKYHYSDIQDPNVIINYSTPKDINYAINNDVNELKLYQNSLYITGIIACATLLITAILISKK